MTCTFYLENKKACLNELPLIPLYSMHVCNTNPEKCPVFLFEKTKAYPFKIKKHPNAKTEIEAA